MASIPIEPGADVLERISDGVFVLDGDWRFTFVNSGGARLVERDAASLIGTVIWEQFPRSVDTVFEAQFRRSMERHEDTEFDAYSEDLQRWFAVRTFPSPTDLTVIFQDATQRKAADDAIRSLFDQLQRQRRLATVLAETNEAVFRARSVSELFRGATSIAVEQGGFVMAWIGVLDPATQYLTEVAHAGDGAQDYLRDLLISSREGPLGEGIGGRALRHGLDEFSTDILSDAKMAPWRDAAVRIGYRSSGALPLHINGEIRGLLSVYAREVSYFNDDERNLVHRLAANVAYGWEALQLEEDLRESEVARRTSQRFEAILSAAPDAIVGLGGDGRIEMTNSQVHALFGWDSAEIIGESVELLIPFGEGLVDFAQWVGHLHPADGSRHNDGVTARRRDGSRFPADVALSSVVDDSGHATFIVSVRDLTERLEFEGQRRRAELEAQREQQDRLDSLGRLAGGVAHDFNNLLGVVLNFVTLIEKQELAAQTRLDISQVRAATERGISLTRQLLTFARREPTHVEPIELARAVRDIGELLQRSLGPSVTLLFDLSPEKIVVDIDRQQLDQVVANLVINARDAMPEGGRIVVSVSREEHPDLPILLQIRDTGVGMSPETAARVFEPFFTTKPRGQGTGLGLATVYGIVSRAGGSVSIDSHTGVGTTFDVRFPEPLPREFSLDDRSTDALSERSNGERILLVEDDPQLREATRRLLVDAGYDVRTAGDGGEALATIENLEYRVALVISDVVMPSLTGIELAQFLRRKAPELPVVLMTGYNSNPPVDGDDRVTLFKPVDEATLLRTIADAIHGR
jgi:PAS domain S-box-containing protein